MIRDLVGCLRVRQWTKNILVFAAMVFSQHAFEPEYMIRSACAFTLFSLISGSVYILNDILDIESDRKHPQKKNRPLPSGKVSLKNGWTAFIVLSTVSLTLAFMLDVWFGSVLFGYVLLQALYSRFLKNIVILDVFVVSFGFLLRVVAGAVVIHVVISNWILVCTMLLALFLVLSKRRHELTLLEDEADAHRIILREYSPYLLDQMIGVVTSATLVTYMIFTLSSETIAKFGPNMIFTVPFVLYGIFRYLYLVHQKNRGGQPEEVLLTDLPLQIDILLYALVCILVVYL